jgi:hypothetical protein
MVIEFFKGHIRYFRLNARPVKQEKAEGYLVEFPLKLIIINRVRLNLQVKNWSIRWFRSKTLDLRRKALGKPLSSGQEVERVDIWEFIE